jgi:hypothetical protein
MISITPAFLLVCVKQDFRGLNSHVMGTCSRVFWDLYLLNQLPQPILILQSLGVFLLSLRPKLLSVN